MSDCGSFGAQESNTDVVALLLNAFADAISEEQASQADIMESICQFLTYNLSGLCPNCRQRTLDYIERLLPVFAKEAARLAATYPDEPTCHNGAAT